jgi:hypothetical protein
MQSDYKANENRTIMCRNYNNNLALRYLKVMQSLGESDRSEM